MNLNQTLFQSLPNRREMLQRCGFGIGSLAAATLLAEDSSDPGIQSPLSPRQPHFTPRAKHIIHVFANGGPSQVDTFDPKPALEKLHGKKLSDGKQRNRRTAGVAHASPFKFAKHGECGMEISELFPRLAGHADDLCLIRSMTTDIPNHEQALMMMNCGDMIRTMPSVGSWTLYGLGTENQSLPGYVVMCPGGLPTARAANWRSAFLPGVYQGMHVDTRNEDPTELVDNVQNETLVPKQQRRQLGLIQQLNRVHRASRSADPQLEARIESLELAFRMQGEALDAFDTTGEPEKIQQMYGTGLHGRQMLIARRLVERGVRYVQVYHGAGQPWDSHQNIKGGHQRLASETDQPLAALLSDLKRLDLLDETLVIFGGEMGRTPTVQLPVTAKVGRDHHHRGFSYMLAGGGTKRGYVHGTTEETGLDVVEDEVHVHDFHATLLHLLGFDHERLTYRYAGRDFRLTDVHGKVVQDIIA
ncbi:DUF1501 domain-containing protein [Roseiconus lacunae]|uniref:DUF1501 domain-containing protein n=1 Tax=Roseiconus lacunae TaxID=2605694 RepID=A0ABT7PDY6_9BACT|nr:DUF1501 domain-containing protein [Roseiconus lacunae]MDM4014494.1 DUF1501 domain-containing protein [Roseiconus lacunae]